VEGLMLRIEKVDGNSKQRIIDLLRFDVVHHVFAFYDIQYEPQHTNMYVAFQNEGLRGYVLVYTALDFPSIVLEGESRAAQRLLDYAPRNQFIMHVPPDLLPTVKRKFPSAKCYVENWMLVKKDEAKFFRSTLAHRLQNADDAAELAELLSANEEHPKRAIKKYLDLISKMPTYGVFLKGKLVSYAGSFLQLPQVWMIGGVFTHPDHRNKGYATLATSAVTKEALKNAEEAALFVRADNYSAIKAYEKIGYKKVGEKVWVDVDTGRKP
jgi:RimJ/RimL family protein N-acetyltransferase